MAEFTIKLTVSMSTASAFQNHLCQLALCRLHPEEPLRFVSDGEVANSSILLSQSDGSQITSSMIKSKVVHSDETESSARVRGEG